MRASTTYNNKAMVGGWGEAKKAPKARPTCINALSPSHSLVLWWKTWKFRFFVSRSTFKVKQREKSKIFFPRQALRAKWKAEKENICDLLSAWRSEREIKTRTIRVPSLVNNRKGRRMESSAKWFIKKKLKLKEKDENETALASGWIVDWEIVGREEKRRRGGMKVKNFTSCSTMRWRTRETGGWAKAFKKSEVKWKEENCCECWKIWFWA